MPGIVAWSCAGSVSGRRRSVSQLRSTSISGFWAALIRPASARSWGFAARPGARSAIVTACWWCAIIICTKVASIEL